MTTVTAVVLVRVVTLISLEFSTRVVTVVLTGVFHQTAKW